MHRSRHVSCRGALFSGIVIALLVGCGKNDSISQDEKTETAKPSIAETKAIAEEGFIYGLPIVKRAAVAKAGIYANDPVEAMYPLTKTLANGETLDGSKHNYTLTFPAGQLPPVNSFWSVTMYDAKTQLLIENPINRYLINSPMLQGMRKNKDGSLTISLQKDPDG
jgi:hypothetical protein